MCGICLYSYNAFFTHLFLYILILLVLAITLGSILKLRYVLSISLSLLIPISGYLNAAFNAQEILNFDLKKTKIFVFEVIDFPN